MRRTRPLVQGDANRSFRRRRDVIPQPVPTFQPDLKAPLPPQPSAASEDEAVEAAINRMVEAAYT